MVKIAAMKQIFTWIGAALIALVGAIGGRLIGKAQGRRQGKQEAQNDALQDHATRTENGRMAVQDGRDRGGDPAQRLRANDGH